MTDEDQLLESPLSSYALSQVCLKKTKNVKSLKMGRERDRQTDK